MACLTMYTLHYTLGSRLVVPLLFGYDTAKNSGFLLLQFWIFWSFIMIVSMRNEEHFYKQICFKVKEAFSPQRWMLKRIRKVGFILPKCPKYLIVIFDDKIKEACVFKLTRNLLEIKSLFNHTNKWEKRVVGFAQRPPLTSNLLLISDFSAAVLLDKHLHLFKANV
jgi:hypothetical protein